MNDVYKSSIHMKLFDDRIHKLSSNFSCGNSFIDGFLKGNLSLNPGIGTTYVWLNDEESEIIGFYNITTGSLEYLDEDSRFKMGGAIHINEFALDEKYQGLYVDDNTEIKMSDMLLMDCINRVMDFRKILGFSFVTLHSTSEGFNLYTRHDFIEIEDDMRLLALEGKERDCIAMYIPLDLE